MSKDAKELSAELLELLPDNSPSAHMHYAKRQELADKVAEKEIADKTKKELANMRYKEERKLQRQLEAGSMTEQEIAEKQEQLAAIKMLEDSTKSLAAEHIVKHLPANAQTANLLRQAQGTTRTDIAKLLTSLNINLNLQLSKNDTSNLLACLLTCNETQLDALYKNKKLPLAIKIVIKRIKEDAKLGNMDTVEKLWDRIFGPKGMYDANQQQQQIEQQGIIPSQPVSREAYIAIRETIIK